jgi:hypothetical protein
MRKIRESTKTNPRDHQPFEKLEPRVLLSTVVPGSVGDVKNGPMANSGASLIALYREYRSYSITGGSASNFQASQSDLFVNRTGMVAVTVRGTSGINDVTNEVRSVGGAAFLRNSKFQTVDAYIPISQLRTLAVGNHVMSVTPIIAPATESVGNADNQADPAENADKARTIYGVDGTGVKVGVISDSVDQFGTGVAGSIATGNLPANGIDVIADETDPAVSRTDEGRAMLELIHDIAPGADLSFATADPSQSGMADNIRRLAANGANVIVDDIKYFQEPMFEPGVIDDAIHDVTQNGVVYLSSVGNNLGAGYEAPTNFVTIKGKTYVDFDPGPGVQTRMQISFPGDIGGTLPFELQWDNPYNGVIGNATTDLDVTFFDPRYPNRILASGSENNLKTGIPEEFIDNLPARTMDIQITVADHVAGQPLPTRFKFVVNNDGVSTMTTQFPQFQVDAYGHNAGQDVISVGAVPFTNAPPFAAPGTSLDNEDFSSIGPVTLLFDADGHRLATPLVIQKPDLSGIDGVNTSFFGQPSTDSDSLPNFFGTSAAAPDVAAVVALIKQADPGATQAQILSALKATAKPTNGSPAGQWDPKGGFGLIDAQAAIQQFVAAPTAQIIPVSPDPTDAPVKQIKIVFSQEVSGFDVSDLLLTFDGGPNVLTGANAPVTTDGGRTWFIPNLANVTDLPGAYTLELTNATGLIVNAAGLPFQQDLTETFTNIGTQTVPSSPSGLAAKVLSDSAIQLRWTDNSFNETGFLLQRATDPAFTQNIRNIRLDAGTTSFTDTSLPAGQTFYYRVRANSSFAGVSSFSNTASGTTLSRGEIILDNESSKGVKVVGDWETSSSSPGFFGSSYLDDLDSDKGHKTVTYTPNITAAGDYFVYARWTGGADRATNVPFVITFADGSKTTVTVNERDTGGKGFVLLGKFSFDKGTFGSVQIRNAGTNGTVVADAIEFLPADANM